MFKPILCRAAVGMMVANGAFSVTQVQAQNAKPTPKPALAKPALAKPAAAKPTVKKPVVKPVAPKIAPVKMPILAPETVISAPGGATVLARVDRSAPRVAISLIVRAGASDEIVETAGWRRLLTDAMLRAAKPLPGVAVSGAEGASEWMDAPAMQQAAERLGGRLSAAVGDDAIELSVSGSSAQLIPLLDLVANLAANPRLSDEDIDGARRGLLRRLDSDGDDIASRATSELRARLYRDARGELAAYGLPPGGSLQSLNNLTGERVRLLHRAFFDPSRRVLSVAGDVDLEALKGWVAKQSAGIGAPFSLATPFLVAPDSTQPPLVVRQFNTPAAWVFVAFATGSGTSSNPADWPALQVLAAALGESPRGRLPKKLLDNRLSLGGVNPTAERLVIQFAPRRFRGEFVMFAQTSTPQVEGVKNILLDEVKRLQNTPLPATELTNAKNFARGAFLTDRESLRERAAQSALLFAQTKGASNTTFSDADWPNRLQKVSAKDVQNAARKYLQSYAVALVLPSE